MRAQQFTVSRREAGRTVAEVLQARLALPRSRVQQLIRERRVWLGKGVCPDPARRVRAGQQLEVRDQRRTSRSAGPNQPVIRYVDDQVVVVDKPPGLTTMRHPDEAAEFGARGRRFLPTTLADILPQFLADRRSGRPVRVRAVHRLDKDTSGLVVFARTPEAERHLGRQFRAHSVERRYLAVVRGRATSGRIESYLVRDRGDGRRGSTPQAGQGKRAVTHVELMEDLGDYTLVSCRLETGRTHQVRIHLGENGTPLCGERVYDRPLHGQPVQKDGSGFPRPALHAASLGFVHPRTGKHLSWTAPLPADMAGLVKKLRKAKQQSAKAQS
jgi:23S rRNA pseudouridine1911/1915/1917 synthase